MTGPAQACGNCKWHQFKYGEYGSCGYPMPAWARELLLYMHRTVFPGEGISPATRHNNDGKDCPTWTSRQP